MNKNELIQAFRRIGIREDSCFIVHSSLKSFGHVDGGAETVVEAILETAPKGTIVMPSFNHGVPYEQGQCFDIRSTPTINGAIPEAFRKRADVLRSMDPTHSYAVLGKDAREIVLLHEKSDTMGIGSPLDYLYKHNGFVLLLGVDFRRNTFHHYVETVTNAPCLRGKGEAYDVIDANGEHKTACTWSWRESDCPIDDPGAYAPLMEKYTQTQYIGGCKAMWFAMSDCFNVVRDALQNGMDGHSPCSKCTVRPRVCQYTI